MDILCSLIEYSEKITVCSVTISTSEGQVCVLGAATVAESGRFVELAQARAVVLARQILAEGLDSVDPTVYMTSRTSAAPDSTMPTAVSPPQSPEPPLPELETAVFDTAPVIESEPSSPALTEAGADAGDLPEVPW